MTEFFLPFPQHGGRGRGRGGRAAAPGFRTEHCTERSPGAVEGAVPGGSVQGGAAPGHWGAAGRSRQLWLPGPGAAPPGQGQGGSLEKGGGQALKMAQKLVAGLTVFVEKV